MERELRIFVVSIPISFTSLELKDVYKRQLHNNIHDWFCVEDNFCIWEELQTISIAGAWSRLIACLLYTSRCV